MHLSQGGQWLICSTVELAIGRILKGDLEMFNDLFLMLWILFVVVMVYKFLASTL
ncbi:MAG: hypothetical protein NC930_05580 [Candidatus Omnitrophica bacterium]|nr:hypothetical protein [Candidatus Omnitrophota bacterium]